MEGWVRSKLEMLDVAYFEAEDVSGDEVKRRRGGEGFGVL